MQSGGPNRERLYRAAAGGSDGWAAGGLDGRADRTRVELNGRERDRDVSLIVMIRTGGSLI